MQGYESIVQMQDVPLPPLAERPSRFSSASSGYPRVMARNLSDYERKRDPKKTSEPFGNGKPGKQPIFVVQRHDARRLHYDFRLEIDGALASWAVPKGRAARAGPTASRGARRGPPARVRALRGAIPAGQYGAGSVEIWDHGTFELVEQKRDGGLTVRLHGERLEGTWALVPAHLSGEEKNWLIIRKRDTAAPAQRGERREYKPMLATLAEELPTGRGLGLRGQMGRLPHARAGREQRGDAREPQRQGPDDPLRLGREGASARAAHARLRARRRGLRARRHGRASFSAMQQGSARLVYYVFDLLELEGVPLVEPAAPRAAPPARGAARPGPRPPFGSPRRFDDGEALYEAAVEQGLEGIMAKRPGSRYYEGKRTRDWLKLKTRSARSSSSAATRRARGGVRGASARSCSGCGAATELEYVGNCGTGFTEQEIDAGAGEAAPAERKTSPFAVEPKMPRVRKGDVVWVKPELVCEVEFVEWTHDGHLRAPAYKGLRDDKEAKQVKREQPVATERRKGRRVLKLSNLDKPFWPEEGITKGDLIAYYEAVAPVLIPHIKDRPFTMKRYPDGWNGPHFFQKDAPKHMPDWIPTVPVVATPREKPRTPRTIDMPVVNDELALLWMVNMGCIDMNTWYSRVDKPERPDFVLFDLDPSEGVPSPRR